jgi:hypothetical protein
MRLRRRQGVTKVTAGAFLDKKVSVVAIVSKKVNAVAILH